MEATTAAAARMPGEALLTQTLGYIAAVDYSPLIVDHTKTFGRKESPPATAREAKP